MLEVILDKQILLILMGVSAGLGVLSKCIVNVSLKRLVRAAGNMNKSTHALMRLIRAKFEHACMISDKVQNVGVFVDKYLYEYKVAGLRLHSLRRMETGAAWMCLLLGAAAAFLEYYLNGMGEYVIRYGAMGAIMAVLLFLFHLTTDEKYQLDAAKNYMVDYLENVCAHRCAKMYRKEMGAMASQEFTLPDDDEDDEDDYDHMPETAAVMAVRKAAGRSPLEDIPKMDRNGSHMEPIREPSKEAPEINEPERPHPREEVPSPTSSPEITPPVMPDPIPVSSPSPHIQAIKAAKEALAKEDSLEKKALSKEVLIREILEEFLA